MRNDVREYVVAHLHDETGNVREGTHTVGVRRQYTGIARRTENSQVAVRLVCDGARGHAAVDRELYALAVAAASVRSAPSAGTPCN